MNESVSVALKSDLIGLFEKSNGELESGSGHFMNFHRGKAFSDFERLGIPTTKNENYRYTPLEQYFNGQYEVELSPNPFKIDIKSIFKCDVPELDTHVVLVLNGFFASGVQISGLPKGVLVCSLSEASVKY